MNGAMFIIVNLLIFFYCFFGYIISSLFIELYKADEEVKLYYTLEDKIIFISSLVLATIFWPLVMLYLELKDRNLV
jgi:uncharacterized protein with PQ loop repeat